MVTVIQKKGGTAIPPTIEIVGFLAVVFMNPVLKFNKFKTLLIILMKKIRKEKIMEYKYFSTQRPITPGSCPKDNIVEIENFEDKIYCKEIFDEAWGSIIFNKPLSKKELETYELYEVLSQNQCVELLEKEVSKIASNSTLIETSDKKEKFVYYFNMPASYNADLLKKQILNFFGRKLKQTYHYNEKQLTKYDDFIDKWIDDHCYLEKSNS